MADFPDSLRVFLGSKEEWLDPRMVAYSLAGAPKIRLLADAKRRKWSLSLKDMTDADFAVLEAFYDANRNVTFNLTWKGVTYTAAFLDSSMSFTYTEPTYRDNTSVGIIEYD